MSLAENWLPGCIEPFRERHPDLRIAVHGTVWNSPNDQVADIIISVNRHDDVPTGAIRLWNETLSLVCAPDMARGVSSFEDVCALPKIVVAGRQEYWATLGDAIGDEPFDLENAMKTNASNVSLELAAHGLGAVLALTSLSRLYVKRGILSEPLNARPDSPWSYYARLCQDRHDPGCRRVFRAYPRVLKHLEQPRNRDLSHPSCCLFGAAGKPVGIHIGN